jgi:hypothetical protein
MTSQWKVQKKLTVEEIYRKLCNNESFVDVIDLYSLVQCTSHKLSKIGRMIANNTIASEFAVYSIFPDITAAEFQSIIDGLDYNVGVQKISIYFEGNGSALRDIYQLVRLFELLTNMQRKLQYIKTVTIDFMELRVRDSTYHMKKPIEEFLLKMSNLETLEFYSMDIKSIPTLMEMLSTLSNLHTLKLKPREQFHVPQLASIFNCVDMLPKFTTLVMGHTANTQADIEYIFAWITSNTKITHFTMPWMSTQLTAYHDPPERDISELLGNLITKLIATNTTLKWINFRYELSTIDWSQMHKDTKLESFIGPWRRLVGSDAPELIKLLKTNTTLTEFAYNTTVEIEDRHDSIVSLLHSGRSFNGLFLNFNVYRLSKEKRETLIDILCEYINTTPELYKLHLQIWGIICRPMFEKLINTIAKNMFLTELSLVVSFERPPEATRLIIDRYIDSMLTRIYDTNINLTTLHIDFNTGYYRSPSFVTCLTERNKRLSASLSSLLMPSSVDF